MLSAKRPSADAVRTLVIGQHAQTAPADERPADPAPRRLRNHAVSSLAATSLLTTVIRFAQAGGYTRMDLPIIIGTVVTADRDRAKAYGFLIHMVNGWLFSGVYVATFQALRRSGVVLGAVIGLIHGTFVLAAVLPLLPGAHGRMASDFTGPQPTTRLEPPGFMASNYGRSTPIVTLLAHMVYGGVLGGFYQAGSVTGVMPERGASQCGAARRLRSLLHL